MTEEQWEPEEWDIDEIDRAAFISAQWLLWEIECAGILVTIKRDKVATCHGEEFLSKKQLQALKDLEMYVLTVLVIRDAMRPR